MRPAPLKSQISNRKSQFANRKFILPLLLLSSFLLTTSAAPHPIADSSNSQLHPDLQISLFAREPDVLDPVAVTFDERGRVFVVEMRDYPYGLGPDLRPGGTIRLLEDLDADGRSDRSIVFAENLSFPTSIAPWNGGLIVSAPPEVIFLKDTDGDNRADLREVLLKGFNREATDSNLSGLRWGLDNRLHANNGGNGGNITSTRRPGEPVSLRGLDFSFDPSTGDLTTTHQTSGGFGLAFDDWGRSFASHNVNHLQQRIIPARYLARFPGLPPIDTTQSISDHGAMARIFPISIAQTRPNHPEQAGYFSSSGGVGYAGWSGLPGDLSGSIFIFDVVGNLVHRDILKSNGPILTASRAPGEQTHEFFASRDNSFRPVGVELGPDGALYLLDMQRDVIEHPDYIPERMRTNLNIRAGDDRGRIYRLTPRSGLPDARRDFSSASTSNLISELSHPNQTHRVTAQRLLVERHDSAAVEPLRRLATDGREPLGRLHALWTLRGLNALDEPIVARALADPHPGIRENALLLAETFTSDARVLPTRVLALAEDPDPRVRFQAALTLGEFNLPSVPAALRTILLADHASRWTRLAVLSSLRSGADQLLISLLPDQRLDPVVLRELSDLAAARDGASGVRNVLRSLTTPGLGEPARLAALEGLRAGLSRNRDAAESALLLSPTLDQLELNASSALQNQVWKTRRALGLPDSPAQTAALNQAVTLLSTTAGNLDQRLAAIHLLALAGPSTAEPVLLSLLQGTQPAAIQSAALTVLEKYDTPPLAGELLQRWNSLAPALRPAVINLILRRNSFHPYLLAAVERGAIKPGELNLDLEQRRRLLRHSTDDVKSRAAKIWGDEEYSNRKPVLDQWLARLPTTGDPLRGRVQFEKTCIPCHTSGKLGFEVGPDLTSVAHRSVEDLLYNILDPNMAIDPGYVTYRCDTAAGESEVGILKSESADAITLLQASGKQVTIPRRDITLLESTGLSLMPEGLEAGLTPADLRDLIAFLQSPL